MLVPPSIANKRDKLTAHAADEAHKKEESKMEAAHALWLRTSSSKFQGIGESW